MKKYLISFLALIAIFFSACNDNQSTTPDIKLVPVYAISNIIGTNPAYAIEVYREKTLMLIYSNNVNLKSFAITDYVDSSNDSDFKLSFRASEKAKAVLGGDTLINSRYELNGLKATNLASLKVVSYIKTDSLTRVFNVKIAEESRYN